MSKDEYVQNENLTVSERVFFKWLKEMGALRFKNDNDSLLFNEEDENKNYHKTYVALRGPVETKINYIQKHEISIDTPNHSLNILLPYNEDNVKLC